MKYGLTLLLVFCATVDALADTYVVTPNSDDYLNAVVELTLDRALESDTAFSTRSVGGVAPTITDARCTFPAELAEIKVQGLNWIVPKQCLQISWSLSFQSVGDRAYELSRQESLHHPKGWWFLNESGSLLRYAGQEEATVCARFVETEKCTNLSALNRAPMFLVFGTPERVLDWQGGAIEVYTGFDAIHLKLEELLGDFLAALRRIDAMTTSISEPEEHSSPLQFVWLGISAEHETVGGAAGKRAFLSNFRVDGDTVTEIERSRLLIISGHEYMHMIGVNAGAHWATETLATYYGYKAVAERVGAQQAFEQMAYVEHPEAPVMVRGAALWRELDDAIEEATHRAQSLDDFLVLLTGAFDSETYLPADFLQAVARRVGQARLDSILSAYFKPVGHSQAAGKT